MLKAVAVCILFFCQLIAVGQNPPAFRQFYCNPFLFNPAFAGINGYTSISVLYRKQWVNFNNAPKGGGFTIEYPTKNKISVGVSFLSQDVVALRTSSLQVTFAYRIPLASNQFLFFGLSGVAGSNTLDISDADYSNDPAILAAANDTYYADVNFGAVYELGGLRAGFALPKMIKQDYYGSQNDKSSYDQFLNQLYSLSYKFRRGNFTFEPYALYRKNQDFQNWWEAATIVYFNEKIWLGGSYHSTQGVGFFFGVDIKEKFRFGYSYELPPADKEFVSTSSHELQLQFRLGKKRVYKWAAKYAHPVEEELSETAPSETEPSPDTLIVQTEPEEEIAQVKVTEPIHEVNAPIDTLTVEAAVVKPKPPVQQTLAAGLYVIAGTFRNANFALNLLQKLENEGYEGVQFGLNPKNGLYCVYVFSSYDVEECKQAAKTFQEKEATRGAWLLRIEK